MIYKNFLLIAFIFASLVAYATEPLKFNKNGDFKIVQFTDVHYKPEKQAQSDTAILLIERVLKAEKPDLVVFSGDLAWGKPVFECFDKVLEPVIKSSTPWAFVFGNHDDEQGATRTEIMDYLITKPYCYAQAGPKSLKGVGNYILEVKGAEDKTIQSLLYFLDSNSYNNQYKGVGWSYDWFGLDQVQWYTDESNAYTKSHDGVPYPSLAFFHIPLVEYAMMTSLPEKGGIIGSNKEKECNGKINTGMFAAMLQGGDVMGMFVGHDHDNDYIGVMQDMAMAYGRFSGGNTVYNNLGQNGARIINLKEGDRGFSTYIRLLDGSTIYPVTYPDSFVKEEKAK